MAGPKFGMSTNVWKNMIRDLYGFLKSSGVTWHASCLTESLVVKVYGDMGFSPYTRRANLDVWMKTENDSDRDEYYSYILVYYVDDILVLHKDPWIYMMKSQGELLTG